MQVILQPIAEAVLPNTILTQNHSNWMEITLNRPERLNAFNDEMHIAIQKALEQATDPKIRAVVLTGAGRGFCAGQDLDGRDPRKMDGPPDLGKTLSALYNPLVHRLRNLAKPVICAVNGVAAGAGANIVFGCDIVLAADNAKFVQSFANVGLIPDAGGTYHLTQILGPLRAKAWAMTATPITAATAKDWGLVWECFAPEDLIEAARAMARKLAQGATFGLAHTKAAIHHVGQQDLDAHMALEAEIQRTCGQSADYLEGVTAFLDKRPARFTGA
jgi:2-(1,2-epoxy-1,2-dihydrophenyl)acetyl-CoA isomerase|tara:strand:+ start:25276 stop:26097 length:822 start_codon:yes stop_codon:yes gene_type:complete